MFPRSSIPVVDSLPPRPLFLKVCIGVCITLYLLPDYIILYLPHPLVRSINKAVGRHIPCSCQSGTESLTQPLPLRVT